jgi:hypothetical protein
MFRTCLKPLRFASWLSIPLQMSSEERQFHHGTVHPISPLRMSSEEKQLHKSTVRPISANYFRQARLIESVKDGLFWSPAHELCVASRFKEETIIARLKEMKHVDEPDDFGQIPLWWAAHKGKIAVVKYLINERGCNPFQEDNDDKTAIHALIHGGNISSVFCGELLKEWKPRLMKDPWILLDLAAGIMYENSIVAKESRNIKSFSPVLQSLWTEVWDNLPEEQKTKVLSLVGCTQPWLMPHSIQDFVELVDRVVSVPERKVIREELKSK